MIGKRLRNSDGSITYEYAGGFGQTYHKQMNFEVKLSAGHYEMMIELEMETTREENKEIYHMSVGVCSE